MTRAARNHGIFTLMVLRTNGVQQKHPIRSPRRRLRARGARPPRIAQTQSGLWATHLAQARQGIGRELARELARREREPERSRLPRPQRRESPDPCASALARRGASAPALWARSLMGNPPSTLPPPGYVTSPAPPPAADTRAGVSQIATDGGTAAAREAYRH
jgi:hypothetical protein